MGLLDFSPIHLSRGFLEIMKLAIIATRFFFIVLLLKLGIFYLADMMVGRELVV